MTLCAADQCGVRQDRAASDSDLAVFLRAARSGKQSGFTAIYALLGGRVSGYLRSRGVAEVDDVTNEIFAAAFHNLHTFKGTPSQFRSWLFRIAWNKSADWHRQTPRRLAPVERDDLERPSTADVEAAAMARLERERVSELLERLTADQRDVIELRIIGDLSLEQTAETLGKPVGAVKSLQHRALAALGRILSAEAVSPETHEPITGAR